MWWGSKIKKQQLPNSLRDIALAQEKKYDLRVLAEEHSEIPPSNQIFTEQSNKWIKIDGVICVFVDMKNSTVLSDYWKSNYTEHEMAKIYTLFTGTAVKFFHELGASRVDIKGDGVFGLFNSSQVHRALAAAVAFKTFAETIFHERVSKVVRNNVSTGAKIGIHQSSVFVRKVGLKKDASREDRHNEVWVGDAVNFAAKLSSLSTAGEIYISPHFYENISAVEAKSSCSCVEGRGKVWKKVKTDNLDKLPLSCVYKTDYYFCEKHGEAAYNAFIRADAFK